MTTIVFQVKNIPAALYKAMGGFATNNVNMVKLESYMVSGTFTSTQFYADIEGHPEEEKVKRALDELVFFTSVLKYWVYMSVIILENLIHKILHFVINPFL